MRKLQLLILIASVAVTTEACNDSGTAVFNPPADSANTCIWNGVTLSASIAAECCTSSNGVMTYNYNSGDSNCPGGTPYQASIQQTLGNYTGTAAAGNTSLNNANGLVSSDVSSKNTSGTAAATASFKPFASNPDGAALSNTGSGSATGLLGGTTTGGAGNYTSTGGGQGGGGSGSSLFGSGGLGSGNTTTTTASDSGATAASGALGASGGGIGADGSGAYALTAGGNGGGGHGGLWSAVFGDGSGDFGAGGAKGSRTAAIVDMSRNPASDDGNAMGSKDPDNYFSLVNRDDSIFKIVERRYTSQAKQWALTDANAVASKAIRLK